MKNVNLIILTLMVGLACIACKNETGDATATKKVNTETTTAPVNKKPTKKGYNIGDEVADFKLKNVDGKMVSLSDYKDQKGVAVVFTCNTCPYSVKYEDRINDFHNAFAAQGFPVLAINPNDPAVRPGDNFEGMVERAKEKDFNFAYVFDEGQKIYPKFGATRTPEFYLLKNEGGKMKVAYTGALDDNTNDPSEVKDKYLEMAVQAVSKGAKVDPNFTKAIGCTIKVKKS